MHLTVASKILAKTGADAFDEFHKSVMEPRYLENQYLGLRCR